MTAPNAKPDRNACIVRDYTHGEMTQEQIGRAYGITAARVGQIIRDARIREQRERCARGEHGRTVPQSYETWRDGRMVSVEGRWCLDCSQWVEL